MKKTLRAIISTLLLCTGIIQAMEQHPNLTALKRVFEKKYGQGKNPFAIGTRVVPTTFGFDNPNIRIKCADNQIIEIEPKLAQKSEFIKSILKKQFKTHRDCALSFATPNTQKDIYDNPAIDLTAPTLTVLFECVHNPKEISLQSPETARTLLHTAEYLAIKPTLMHALCNYYNLLVENIKEDMSTYELFARYSKQIEKLIAQEIIGTDDITSNCTVKLPNHWHITLKGQHKALILAGKGLTSLFDIQKVTSVVNPQEVTLLDLHDNQLTRVNLPQLLAIFPNLQCLNLANNKMRYLRRIDFKKMPAGFGLILHSNEIEKIENGTFSNIENIKIDLSCNRLSKEEITKIKNAITPTHFQRATGTIKKAIVSEKVQDVLAYTAAGSFYVGSTCLSVVLLATADLIKYAPQMHKIPTPKKAIFAWKCFSFFGKGTLIFGAATCATVMLFKYLENKRPEYQEGFKSARCKFNDQKLT
ncbi:MAG: hypothetical protein AB7F19_06735 [Candidatus Babeliales bacterium]